MQILILIYNSLYNKSRKIKMFRRKKSSNI